jgi:hypothetical protein
VAFIRLCLQGWRLARRLIERQSSPPSEGEGSEIRRDVQHQPTTFAMTHSEKARKSTRAVSEWIGDADDERGYERILGEVARTKEPHARSLTDGQAQTMHST